MTLDTVIVGGLWFDGTGAPGRIADVGIKDGRVAAIGEPSLPTDGVPDVVDARGRWVMPGFLDIHTHYDAELLAAPSLSESVRHGVTTVTVGSCSISLILSEAEDCSDLFTRVEAVPRAQVLPLLRRTKTWDSTAGWLDFLRTHPLGPNVTSFLGHSDLRVRVMGLARAVDDTARATPVELAEMARLLEEGLDAGLLGLSTMTNPWDKLDGDRFRSKSLPSTYATWREFRFLNAILRRRGRIHQGAPNLVTKVNALLFLAASASFGLRKALKTTLITLMDPKSDRWVHRVIGRVANGFNRLFGADFRWQALPTPFEVYADGMELVVFEEFAAGQAALHLTAEAERRALFQNPSYREQFRKDYTKRFSPRVWHRDLHDAQIVGCPDASVVGMSFGAVADARGCHPVDAFLDLAAAHGSALRWRTTIANDRPEAVDRIMKEPATVVGFADSGAHLRNMAFYNFPLRLLKRVRDCERAGKPLMPIEKAVWRVTGELADWFGVEAGRIRVGDRADVVVVNPDALDERLEAYHEAEVEGLPGLIRMVNRSDGAVDAVFVNGRKAFAGGHFADELGREMGYGRFLPAKVAQ